MSACTSTPQSHNIACQTNVFAGLRIHSGYMLLWRLLHYRLPDYLTTTSLLKPKLHWFSSPRPLLDKGDEVYWTCSHSGTSKFPAFRLKRYFLIFRLHLQLLHSGSPCACCRLTAAITSRRASRTPRLLFLSFLYEEIILQHPAPRRKKSPLAAPALCLLPLSPLTFFSPLRLIVKLIWKLLWKSFYTPWRKENNVEEQCFLVTRGWSPP